MRVRNDYEVVSAEPLSSDGPIQMLLGVVSSDSMQEFRKSNELNIAIPVQGLGRFRISALRQRGTCTVVVRYIGGAIPSLESLSLPPVLGQSILQKSGLILVVGGNSSGKSTTLASLLEHRNASMRGHILTIEDPIEFLIRNKLSIVSQREIGNDTDSLYVALRNATRQGPSVIMIGEIRDREAMSLALAYAQSGHLVLATVHASSCHQALNRILNFYPMDARPTLLSDLSLGLRAVWTPRARYRACQQLPSGAESHPEFLPDRCSPDFIVRSIPIAQVAARAAFGADRGRRLGARLRTVGQQQVFCRHDRKRRLLWCARGHGKGGNQGFLHPGIRLGTHGPVWTHHGSKRLGARRVAVQPYAPVARGWGGGNGADQAADN